MSESGLVSRVSPVQTALRNCTRDEGRSFEFGNQVLISSHRKLLLSKAMVVNVAEMSGLDSDEQVNNVTALVRQETLSCQHQPLTISIRNSHYGNRDDPGADRHHQDTADPVADWMLCSRFMSVGVSVCADVSRHQRRPNIDDNLANYKYPDNGKDQCFDRLDHFFPTYRIK